MQCKKGKLFMVNFEFLKGKFFFFRAQKGIFLKKYIQYFFYDCYTPEVNRNPPKKRLVSQFIQKAITRKLVCALTTHKDLSS